MLSKKAESKNGLSRRIIAEIFIAAAAVLAVFVYVTKELWRNYTYIESTPHAQEAMVVIKETVPDNLLVNINTATINELMILEGIGEVTAQNIIDYRENNNGFLTIDELLKVDGIGEAKLEKIRNYITLE